MWINCVDCRKGKHFTREEAARMNYYRCDSCRGVHSVPALTDSIVKIRKEAKAYGYNDLMNQRKKLK